MDVWNSPRRANTKCQGPEREKGLVCSRKSRRPLAGHNVCAPWSYMAPDAGLPALPLLPTHSDHTGSVPIHPVTPPVSAPAEVHPLTFLIPPHHHPLCYQLPKGSSGIGCTLSGWVLPLGIKLSPCASKTGTRTRGKWMAMIWQSPSTLEMNPQAH